MGGGINPMINKTYWSILPSYHPTIPLLILLRVDTQRTSVATARASELRDAIDVVLIQ